MSKDSFLPQSRGELVWMTAPNLSAVHAFTTRLGGVSEGIFASWNLGENRGDDPDRVRRNYALLGQALGFDYRDIVFTRQIHENNVRVVTAADRHRLFTPVPYEADGLITDEKNVPLIIFTADCVPILLQDPVRGVIGAVHAGWRGSVLDIAGTAIRQMGTLFGMTDEYEGPDAESFGTLYDDYPLLVSVFSKDGKQICMGAISSHRAHITW